MSSGRDRGIFYGLPIPADKSYLREGLSQIDESWAAACFYSLPHVVHILTSKDRAGEVQFLKEQSDLLKDVVDEVVHAYHHGFNKAIQNYSQILRLFSESAESISVLKVDMAEAKKLLGSRNKQLRQLWYRSLTLRHVLSLLDQIEGVAKVLSKLNYSELHFLALEPNFIPMTIPDIASPSPNYFNAEEFTGELQIDSIDG